MGEAERCRREIGVIEALLRSGHPDLDGLCLALSDWWAELRLIEQHPMTGLEESTLAGQTKKSRRRPGDRRRRGVRGERYLVMR
jgi:hypothetical protein